MGVSEANPGRITIERDIDADIITLSVHGSWTPRLWSATSAGLRKCFAEHPTGLIVDLTALRDDGAASVATWMTAQLRSRRRRAVLRSSTRIEQANN